MISSRLFNCAATWARQFAARALSTAGRSHATPAVTGRLALSLTSLSPSNLAAAVSSSIQHPLSLQKPGARIEELPLHNKIIETPRWSILTEINEIIKNRSPLEAPATQGKANEIRAARLIVIRKRKMKKHKLKKLRKKMKFEWAKVRQRREMRKEKAFQAELLAQIKEAEKFSAEDYVNEKLRQANETPIPRYWKGRRLPQFVIKQKLGIK